MKTCWVADGDRKVKRPDSLPSRVCAFLEDTVRYYPIDRLVLFGSRAIGDHETFSDCDIAVGAPRLSKRDWLDLKMLAYEAHTVVQISLVRLDGMPTKLAERVLRDGRTIYARS